MRVLTSNNYIIKTSKEGIKLLTIDDLKSQKFSLRPLLKANEVYYNSTGSLQLEITPPYFVIATTQNVEVNGGLWKRSIKVMKVKVPKMSRQSQHGPRPINAKCSSKKLIQQD